MATVASEIEENRHAGGIPRAQAVNEVTRSSRLTCLSFYGVFSCTCCSDDVWKWIDSSFEYSSFAGGLAGLAVTSGWMIGMATFIMLFGNWSFQPSGVDDPRRILLLLNSIVSSVLWVSLPFVILRGVVYPDRDALVEHRDDIEQMTLEEQATFDAIALQTAQLRRNRFLAEVEQRAGAKVAAEQRHEGAGVTAVAEELDQSPSITRCCQHALKRLNPCRTSSLDIDEVTRGKLVLFLALVQLCCIPVGLYFYWDRQPILSDLEIYMFNLPAVFIVVSPLLLAGLGVGSVVLLIVLYICVGIPIYIVLRSIQVCYQKQEAERIEKDVWAWFEKMAELTLCFFTWLVRTD